jgi:probable lipoprotein NlpC
VAFSRRIVVFIAAGMLALGVGAFFFFRLEEAREAELNLPSQNDLDRIALVADALRWLGTPYAFGSDGPKAMDCSGFVHRVVVESGSMPNMDAPRKSADFALIGRSVKSEIRPGDILLFACEGRVDHVAIALSSDSFINAVSQGKRRGVVISSFSEECWKDSFAGARRIGREMQ